MSRTVGIVINARAASSRVPRKLIRPFGDTTLLDIALKKMSNIHGVSEKCLAARDDDILSIYEKYSDDIHLLERSEEAVSEGEHDHRVSFSHFCNVESDYIMVMNPCIPFSKISTYENAINYFIDHLEIVSLTSTIEFKDVFFDGDNKVMSLKDVHHISTVTSIPINKMAHVFHIVDKERFCKDGIIFGYEAGDPEFFPVSKYECFDIDEEEDFEFCSMMYEMIGDKF